MTDDTEAPAARLSAEQEAAIRRILDGQGSMIDVLQLGPLGVARLLLAEVDALRAQLAALEAVVVAADDVAHWLQIWINDHPGQTWCYSEAALAKYRAARASSGEAE